MGHIPDADIWPVSERLTAFFFMILDALDGMKVEFAETRPNAEENISEAGFEHARFAAAFKREASGFTTPFHEALREALSAVTRAPDVSSINRMITDTAPARLVVAEMIIQLLSASLLDDSKDRERSAALADKTLAYAASVLATPVPQKAVDVLRYSVEAGYLPLDRIPFVADWLKGDHPEDTPSNDDSSGEASA